MKRAVALKQILNNTWVCTQVLRIEIIQLKRLEGGFVLKGCFGQSLKSHTPILVNSLFNRFALDHLKAMMAFVAFDFGEQCFYCLRLAQNAVHAALAGRTGIVIGRWRGRFVHIPMALAVSHRNQVEPSGDLWLSVLEATGQPRTFG